MTLAPLKSGWLTWSVWLRVLGGLLLLGGSVALAGRVFGVNVLMSIVSGSSRIPTATAVMLLGLGFGLLQAGADRRKPARASGWAVAGFAALIIVSRLAGDVARPDVLLGRLVTTFAPTVGSDQVGATASLSLLLGGLLVVCLVEAGLRSARLAVLSGALLGLTLLTLLKYVTGLQMALPGGLQFGLAVPVMTGLLLLAVTGLVGAARRTAGQRGQPATTYTVAALVMLTCVGLFGLHLNNEQQLATARLAGSYEIVASVNYIELCVTRIELASREFALTRNEDWAAYATDLDHRLRAEINHFNRLLAEHGGEGADAAALRQFVAGMRQEMTDLIRRSREDAPDAGLGSARAAARSSQMELLRDRVNAVEFSGRRRQRSDAAAVQANSYETIKIILIGNVVAGLLGFVALMQMLRAEKRLSATQCELQGANRLQRAVLDGTGLSIIATEPDGIIREFNAGAERMLGYKREEVVGRHTPELVHMASETAARAAELSARLGQRIEPGFETYAALARQGQADEREWTYVRKDGTRFPVQLGVTALHDPAGAITGFLGIAVDLTERRLAEAKLHESEERFRNAFDYAGIGMAFVGLDGRWLQINRMVHHMLGYTEAELLTRTFQEVTHPEDLNADLANVADLLEGRRRHYQMEKRYIHRDGRIVHARLTVTLVRDPAGAPLHFISQIEDITARYQAEQAVADSQRQLSDIFRSMAEGLVLQDAMGRIIECNAAAENILGLSRSQLLGLTTNDSRWQALNEDGTPCPSDRHPAAITRMTGQPCRGVVLGVRKADDTRSWISVNTEAIMDDSGYLKAVVASFSDITDRKQAEEALRQSQQLFQRLFESSPDAIVLVDHNGRIVRTNARAEAVFGWSAGDMAGQELLVLLPQPLRERHGGHLARYFQNPHARAMGAGLELAGLRKDGSEFPVDIMLSPLETPEGLQALAVVRDITARRQMDRVLRESEERMRLFAEHAPASVAMFDREMRYLVHSTKWLKDYGLDGRQIIGRSHYEVFPEIGENWKEIHRRCLAGATELNEADPFDRADGSRQWLSWRVQPWHDGTGAIGGIVMFTEDITHRKELEEHLAAARDQALAASKMKSEFLANVSHEIRTPMNGVLGMADLLMDTRLTEDQRQMGRVIQASAQSLLKLIDDLLDFSKIEAGKFSITTDAFSLTEQVDQALALMAPRAVSGQVSLESDLPADLPVRLWGDAGRIQQVLVNLLGNAVKFTEKGRVTVAVRPLAPSGPGNYAFRIEVRDTGIGISEEQQARLFQPFVQADGSTTRRFGGTGLGLAISRQLIELMGGRIGCESEMGRGSVFWLELELPLGAATTVARKSASPVVPSGTGVRILVAEDQQANQLVMRLLLTKLGLDHTIVGDGQAAIEKLGAEDYALVLMDCQMPRIDGYEATRLIRAGAAGPDRQATPIVALTAHAMASDREKCFEAGMDDYLSKPIRLDALQAILQRLDIHFLPAAPEPEPAAPSVAAVLDPAQLAQLRSLPGRTHPSLLEELAGMALQEMPATLAQLHGHVRQKSAEEAMQTAHRLAGAAANLGASGLRAVLLDIEQAAGAADWPRALRALADLDRAWALVQQVLGDLLPKPLP